MKHVKSVLKENSIEHKDISGLEIMIGSRKGHTGQYSKGTRPVDECELRSLMQTALDKSEMDFTVEYVLIDGNSVWSKRLILQEARKIKKSDSTAGISTYFYKFMHLNFTIAHYNISGWISNYPKSKDVLAIIKDSKVPAWKCDVQAIVNELKEIL